MTQEQEKDPALVDFDENELSAEELIAQREKKNKDEVNAAAISSAAFRKSLEDKAASDAQKSLEAEKEAQAIQDKAAKDRRAEEAATAAAAQKKFDEGLAASEKKVSEQNELRSSEIAAQIEQEDELQLKRDSEKAAAVSEVQGRHYIYDKDTGEFLHPLTATDKQLEAHLLTGNYVVGEEPPAAPKYANADEAKTAIVTWIDEFLKGFTGIVPDTERLSWTAKEMAAKAHLAKSATADDLELLHDEADEAGESIEVLSEKIVFNAKIYRKVISKTAALRRVTFAALDKAESPYHYEPIMEAALTKAYQLKAAIDAS